jgi:small subunit ribosomal protein S3
MGQKVHPTGIRLGIVKDWTSRWYANSQNYPKFLLQDLKVREYIKKKISTRICESNSD